MKKVIILLLIVGLGVGAYFGYYGVQRWKINTALELLTSWELSPVAEDPAQQWVQAQIRANMEELDEQYKQAAAVSKTYKEFEQKIIAIDNANEEKIEKIAAEYKKRKEQREQEKTNL